MADDLLNASAGDNPVSGECASEVRENCRYRSEGAVVGELEAEPLGAKADWSIPLVISSNVNGSFTDGIGSNLGELTGVGDVLFAVKLSASLADEPDPNFLVLCTTGLVDEVVDGRFLLSREVPPNPFQLPHSAFELLLCWRFADAPPNL